MWTGSANWTTDSWTRQENVVVALDSAPLAAAYVANFEELWERRDVERSGRVDPDPVELAGGVIVRPWFTPGHGAALSQAIATAIACARRRVRIASPVITSAPVLATLAELGERGGVDVAGVIDEPQTDAVYGQWATNGSSAWKIPLLAKALSLLPFSGKPSTPWGPATVHDFMHAKVTIADDTVFVGSFNLSRSGEMNAENVLEIHDPALAERMAAFVDAVRARYPRDDGARPGDGDDLGRLVRHRRRARGRPPRSARRRAADRASSRAARTSSRARPGRPGGRSPRRSGSGSAARTVSSSVPKPPGKTTNDRE